MKRRKWVCLGLLCSAFVILCAQGSIAYFTSKDRANQVFTMGDIAIALDEPSWDPNQTHTIGPLLSYSKDPIVTNVGSNDAYVRIRLRLSDAQAFQQYAPKGFDYTSLFDISSTWQLSQGPTVKGDAIEMEYTYQPVLEVGQTSEPLFTKTTFPDFISSEMIVAMDNEFDIIVQADGIQAEGFDNANQALLAFDNQGGLT